MNPYFSFEVLIKTFWKFYGIKYILIVKSQNTTSKNQSKENLFSELKLYIWKITGDSPCISSFPTTATHLSHYYVLYICIHIYVLSLSHYCTFPHRFSPIHLPPISYSWKQISNNPKIFCLFVCRFTESVVV